MERITVSSELVAVIRRLVVVWIDAESGAPAIGGLQNRDGTISWFWDGLPPMLPLSTYRDAFRSVEPFIAFGKLAPGRLSYDNPLDAALMQEQPFAKRKLVELGKGRVALDVTEAHLKLLRNASMVFMDGDDEELFVGIDSKRPYGNMTYFYIDMGRILNIAPAGPPRKDYPDLREFTQPQLDYFDELHETLQPVLQGFLLQAQFEPGTFERPHVRYGDFHRVEP